MGHSHETTFNHLQQPNDYWYGFIGKLPNGFLKVSRKVNLKIAPISFLRYKRYRLKQYYGIHKILRCNLANWLVGITHCDKSHSHITEPRKVTLEVKTISVTLKPLKMVCSFSHEIVPLYFISKNNRPSSVPSRIDWVQSRPPGSNGWTNFQIRLWMCTEYSVPSQSHIGK
jgi:hypothetical protein